MAAAAVPDPVDTGAIESAVSGVLCCAAVPAAGVGVGGGEGLPLTGKALPESSCFAEAAFRDGRDPAADMTLAKEEWLVLGSEEVALDASDASSRGVSVELDADADGVEGTLTVKIGAMDAEFMPW